VCKARKRELKSMFFSRKNGRYAPFFVLFLLPGPHPQLICYFTGSCRLNLVAIYNRYQLAHIAPHRIINRRRNHRVYGVAGLRVYRCGRVLRPYIGKIRRRATV
jgi:hypothetical protein